MVGLKTPKHLKNLEQQHRQPEDLTRALAKKLLTFATGRELGFSDRAEVERMVKESARTGYRVRDLIHLVIGSRIFQSK